MISRSILFYWSKGAEVRREILRKVYSENTMNKPVYLNILARDMKQSHVALKKHVDLLVEEGYLITLNPKGKPVYLRVSEIGIDVLKEFKS